MEIPATNGPYQVQGVNLLPHLESGGKAALPDRYLFWDLYGASAVLHGSWKLVAQLPNHHGDFRRAAQNAAAAQFELYNLEKDRAESRDLSAEQPEIYGDLKERFVAWLRAAGS